MIEHGGEIEIVDGVEYVAWKPGMLYEQFRDMTETLHELEVRNSDGTWRGWCSGNNWSAATYRMKLEDFIRLTGQAEPQVEYPVNEWFRGDGSELPQRSGHMIVWRKHDTRDMSVMSSVRYEISNPDYDYAYIPLPKPAQVQPIQAKGMEEPSVKQSQNGTWSCVSVSSYFTQPDPNKKIYIQGMPTREIAVEVHNAAVEKYNELMGDFDD